jgi:hypothetical protein
MWLVADGLLMGPDAPDNVMGRGQIGLMINIYHVDLPKVAQKTRHVLEFCVNCFERGKGWPHAIDFSYLQ